MIPKRKIVDGKLVPEIEFIGGGPEDGMLCDGALYKYRILIRKPAECIIDNNEIPIKMEPMKFHEYERISIDRYVYKGIF